MESLPSSNVFALLPEQDRAILFDYSSDSFVVTSLTDNTRFCTSLAYDKFQKVSGTFEWLTAKTVKREQRVFLFALIVEVRSTRIYLVSYEICSTEGRMLLVQEHNLDIKSYGIETFASDILMSERERLGDGSGRFHCVFHYLDKKTKPKDIVSCFSIVRVHTDNYGHIHSKKLNKDFISIAGRWRVPFLTDDKILTIVGGDQIPKKMAEIQMSNLTSDDPAVMVSRLRPHQSITGSFPSQTKWSRPIVTTNFALWYVFDKTTESGECWSLNIRTKQWTALGEIPANQHAVGRNVVLEYQSPSLVKLYGECDSSTCKKSHIFSVPLQVGIKV